MQWLHANWPLVLTVLVAFSSEIMPLLPTKANSVVGALVNVAKALLGRGKSAPVPVTEEPK